VTIRGLRDMKKIPQMKESLLELSKLENEGDLIFRGVLAKLIAEERAAQVKDPVKLIVMKELHEITESALDKCSSVGHVIEAIILKNG
jgi:uncharacterized protein Yka (UPF0111/DUF47 family)